MSNLVAEICLYGTSRTGAGWLSATRDGRRFGTGEPIPFCTFTEAIFAAVRELREAGVTGKANIFAPCGERYTEIDVGSYCSTFGMLKWTVAPMYAVAAPDFGA